MTSLLFRLTIRVNDVLRDLVNLLGQSIWYTLCNQKSGFVDLTFGGDLLSLDFVRLFVEILCKLL
jgi:hypothetical protein